MGRLHAALALIAALAAAPAAAARPYADPTPAEGGRVVRATLNVSISRVAPDCYIRTAFTVNGKFGLHTLEVHRGDVLDVELINSIPSDYPDTDEVGTTLHWHGLSLTGSDYWYDGVPYMTQCPVPPGSKQRIRFRVVDGPGLFWWHSHVGLQSADGLSGLLVVRPPRGVSDAAAAIPKHDKEILLTVGDWWHSPGAALAFPIGRPFDRRKQTNATGAYWWADVPQAVLMNGRGIASDCTPLPYLSNATIQCAPKAAWVPPGRLGAVASPGSAAASPGCARTNFTVAAGATVLWRVANVGSLMDLSFCVDGHELTVVAADGVPVAPYKLGAGLCAELNLGQRLDLLMTATTTPGAYWVSALSNYRPAAPHGYAVLKVEAGVAAAPPLPPAPAPQTGAVPPWDVKLLNALTMPAWLAGKADPPAGVDPLLAAAGAPLAVPPRSTRFVFLNNTQPFLPTGQVRWALNQVVNSGPPACGAYAQKVVAAGAAAIEADARLTEAKGANADVGTSLGVQDAGAEEGPVYVYGRAGSGLAALSTPVVGRQVVLLDEGDVVDVVLQNLPPFTNQGNVSRPEDAPKRGEQHPFHLHGHHFWLLGTGDGNWSDALRGTLNYDNPPYRDTATVLRDGWIAFRFRAAAGVHLFHCHSVLHLFMGQALAFAVAPSNMTLPPPSLPACPRKCTAAQAPWDQATVEGRYGASSGYDVGPTSRLWGVDAGGDGGGYIATGAGDDKGG